MSTYHAIGEMNTAIVTEKARSKRSKWIVIGSIIGLVVLIAIGVAVGVVVSNNNKDNKSGSSSGSSSGSTTGGGGSTTGGGGKGGSSNDPSNFALDPALKKVFFGMAYTPEGALIEFGCKNTLANTIKDIQLMSQLTTRVRLYGADCNQTAQVLEAIKQTKVDMQVYAGIYDVPDDHEAFLRQKDIIQKAIETYGTDHIAGITVGNEFMLNYVTERKVDDPNSAIAEPGADILLADIKATRDMLADMKLKKDIPVGNSDAGSYFNKRVLAAVDYGLSNVHAWFAQTTAGKSADWVFNFFDETNVVPAAALPNKPTMYLAETGWPTKSSDTIHASNGADIASVENLQIFIDTFVCRANAAGTGYFFFEMFDEEWKDIKFSGVEGWWGLFNKDRTLKDIKLPDCLSP